MNVSIIIPAYNEEDVLERCLEAICPQITSHDEIILVDNNSTDKTLEIAKKYPVTIISESEQGLIPARNTGFAAAKCEILARIDADAAPNSNWLEILKKVFEDQAVAAATGPVSYYDMPVSKHNVKLDNAFRQGISKVAKDFKFLYGTNMVIRANAWSVIKNKTCSNESEIHEDIDIALHLDDDYFLIHYEPKMVVASSARRIGDPLKDFYKYMKRYTNTYKQHGRDPMVARIPMAIYLSTYPITRFLFDFYDSDKERFSFVKLINHNESLKSLKSFFKA